MKSKMFVLALVGAFLFSLTVYGHHSFGALYSLNKEVKIEGKLVRFLSRNPHSFLHIEVRGEDGKPQVWSVEGAAATQFATAGLKADTLKVGDPIVITGNPTRNTAERRVRLVTMVRTSDGFTWGKQPGQVVD
jgi:hypothetical protein